jgi:hypothetical protein
MLPHLVRTERPSPTARERLQGENREQYPTATTDTKPTPSITNPGVSGGGTGVEPKRNVTVSVPTKLPALGSTATVAMVIDVSLAGRARMETTQTKG